MSTHAHVCLSDCRMMRETHPRPPRLTLNLSRCLIIRHTLMPIVCCRWRAHTFRLLILIVCSLGALSARRTARPNWSSIRRRRAATCYGRGSRCMGASSDALCIHPYIWSRACGATLAACTHSRYVNLFSACCSSETARWVHGMQTTDTQGAAGFAEALCCV